MPLITWAFLGYAGGLLAGFWGYVVPAAGCALPMACATAVRRGALFFVATLFLCGVVTAVVTSSPPPPWERSPGALEPVRSRLGERIDRLFGSDAHIARALLIADQKQMAVEVRERYATAGLVHMLSISGLHVAIIASSLELLLLTLRFRRRHAAALSVLLVFAYVAVLDWRAPAFRAAVMYGTISLSRAVQRPTSPWATLAIGGWIPLVSPRTVMELGYQLSLCGMAALTAAGIIARRLKLDELGPVKSRVLRDLLASTLASLVTAPLVAWYFGRVSLIGPVANLVAGPVISILQPTLFLALALAGDHGAARFVAGAARPLLRAFDSVARTASDLPFAALDSAPTLAMTVALSVGVVAVLVAASGRRPGPPLKLGLAVLALAAWVPLLPSRVRDVELHVLDVGQGDAIALRTDRGNWVLFDAGRTWRRGDAGRSVVVPYVRRRGGNVHAFVMSHPHADHVGGGASVLRWLKPRSVWDPAFPGPTASYRDALALAAQRSIRWRRVTPGDSIAADGVAITFLAPDSAWTASLSDPNEASAVALVTFGSVKFLLTGDAEHALESWLIFNAGHLLDVDVLKVAHHGSRTSSTEEFLDATTPRLAIISVGAENAYAHPSPEVESRLDARGIRTVRTDRGGTVMVRTDGRRLVVSQGGSEWELQPQ
jgi:competence protein ComEC